MSAERRTYDSISALGEKAIIAASSIGVAAADQTSLAKARRAAAACAPSSPGGSTAYPSRQPPTLSKVPRSQYSLEDKSVPVRRVRASHEQAPRKFRR